jgi:hypothetical protein
MNAPDANAKNAVNKMTIALQKNCACETNFVNFFEFVVLLVYYLDVFFRLKGTFFQKNLSQI